MKSRAVVNMGNRKLPGDERGVALLLTLVILVLLTAIIVEFDYGAKVNLITAANFRDEVQAVYLAKSGVAAARAVLKDDALHHGAYDALTEFWAQPIPPYPVGDGFVSVEIADEAGKIDINRLGNNRSQARDDAAYMLKRLLRVLEVDPGVIDPIVEAIKNWVDPDAAHDCLDEFYYQQQNPPYHCKKGLMDTLSELLLVKGVTPEIYKKIRPYVTTVSSPSRPINVNTAGLPVLEALDDNIDPETAACIQDRRPYENSSMSDFFGCAVATPCKDPSSVCSRQIGVQSSYFSVKSSGKMYDTEKVITAMIQRQGSKANLVSWQIE
ncbi:MAG TPA: type II secretion system minor pseudopilin GspK [Nitrospiria bacterium]|nr:type II secretion system minor pseudopilin GspK [Nitrospiria bacterium]